MDKIKILLSPEREVNLYINKALSEGETIRIGHVFSKGLKYRFIADIYLPKGCANLEIPEKSIIEVKYTLLFDTLYRLKKLFQHLKEEDHIENFYVIYVTCSDVFKDTFHLYEKDRFNIISFEELKAKYSLEIQDSDIKKDYTSKLIDGVKKQVKSHKCTLFLGAGVSIDAGLPGWDKLLESLIEQNENPDESVFQPENYDDIERNCAQSSLIIARYIKTGLFLSEENFTEKLRPILYKNIKTTRTLAKTIAHCISENYDKSNSGIESVITYNYDDLIEQELSILGVDNSPVYEGTRNNLEEFPIYHVHGILPETEGPNSKIILCEEDYHDVYKESYLWSTVEQLHALNRTVCFFIGLSMTDPNLRRLLDFSRDLGDKSLVHYVFLQKKKFSETSTEHEDERNDEIQEKIMNDFGLNVIWFKDFAELPKILEQIFLDNPS